VADVGEQQGASSLQGGRLAGQRCAAASGSRGGATHPTGFTRDRTTATPAGRSAHIGGLGRCQMPARARQPARARAGSVWSGSPGYRHCAQLDQLLPAVASARRAKTGRRRSARQPRPVGAHLLANCSSVSTMKLWSGTPQFAPEYSTTRGLVREPARSSGPGRPRRQAGPSATPAGRKRTEPGPRPELPAIASLDSDVPGMDRGRSCPPAGVGPRSPRHEAGGGTGAAIARLQKRAQLGILRSGVAVRQVCSDS